MAQGLDSLRVNSITLEGNKITRKKIILRELTFKEDQKLSLGQMAYKMERSRSNLRNINLFNFVEVDTCIALEDTLMDVVVRMQERWYVFPIPIFKVADRNISEWIENGYRADRLDYGLHLVWNNFRGRREVLELEARFGYNSRFEIEYSFPYLDKKQKWGLNLGALYARNREVSYASHDNKRLFYHEQDGFLQHRVEAYAEPVWRPQLYNTHRLMLMYSDITVNDTVARLNPQYLGNGVSHARFFTLEYTLRRDLRDYNSYPLKGYLFELIMTKHGLGLLGNDINQFETYITFNKYWALHPRWHFVHGTTLKASTTSPQSYFLQKGLGYQNDFVRGYELYVVDAQHFLLIKTSLKWTLMQTKVVKLKFLRSNKFGLIPFTLFLNANLDAAAAIDDQFTPKAKYSNTWLLGGGIGLDLLTYYDVVLRFEYSANRQLQHGFFLHLSKHI